MTTTTGTSPTEPLAYWTATPNELGASPRKRAAIGLTLLVLLLAAMRLIHLGADTPPGQGSIGLYVDEGYKTLSARNLLLFGSVNWHPHDGFYAWHSRSPVTHWSYVAAFKIGGVRVESARVVTVIFFAALLGAFVRFSWNRLPLFAVVAGTLMLGVQATLFFFSRVAIFEIPLAAFFTALLLVARKLRNLKALVALAVIGSTLLVFGIKGSSALYLAPAFIGIGASLAYEHRNRLPRRYWFLGALGAVAAGVAFVWLTIDAWKSLATSASVERWWNQLVESPLIHHCWPLVLVGILCGLHLVIRDPRRFLADRLGTSALMVCLSVLLLLPVYRYDPLRYYVPILPPLVLLVTQWMAQLFERSSEGSRLTAIRAGISVFVIAVLILVEVSRSATTVARFLSRPTYEGRDLHSQLASANPEALPVFGDWAPFIALGTQVPAVFTNRQFNLPQGGRAHDLGIPYLLTCETGDSRRVLEALKITPGVSIGPAEHLGRYAGSPVHLHRVTYLPD